MKLYDATRDYLAYLQHEQGAAKTTFTTYQNRLNNLLRWLETNGYPAPGLDAFTLPTLRRYQYFLSGKGDRPRTLRGCFNAIRSFGAFLVKVGALTENPAAKITLPKLDAAIRLVVNDVEVSALLDACERQRTMRQIALCRAVLSSMIYGGLRRGEAYSLRVGDVNLSEKSLLIRNGKGGKSRKIYVCADGVNAFAEWLAVRESDCTHEWLFAYDRNRRIHDEEIASLIETLKATAGLRDNEAVKPHGLRHWCATNLLRNGANLRDVQQFLGHSDLTTTARYLHSSEEQLRSIAELTALRPPQGKQKPVNSQQAAKPERPRRIARQA